MSNKKMYLVCALLSMSTIRPMQENTWKVRNGDLQVTDSDLDVNTQFYNACENEYKLPITKNNNGKGACWEVLEENFERANAAIDDRYDFETTNTKVTELLKEKDISNAVSLIEDRTPLWKLPFKPFLMIINHWIMGKKRQRISRESIKDVYQVCLNEVKESVTRGKCGENFQNNWGILSRYGTNKTVVHDLVMSQITRDYSAETKNESGREALSLLSRTSNVLYWNAKKELTNLKPVIQCGAKIVGLNKLKEKNSTPLTPKNLSWLSGIVALNGADIDYYTMLYQQLLKENLKQIIDRCIYIGQKIDIEEIKNLSKLVDRSGGSVTSLDEIIEENVRTLNCGLQGSVEDVEINLDIVFQQDALNMLTKCLKNAGKLWGEDVLLSNDNNVKEGIFKTLYEIYNLGTNENKSKKEMHKEVANLYFAQVGIADESALSKFLHSVSSKENEEEEEDGENEENEEDEEEEDKKEKNNDD